MEATRVVGCPLSGAAFAIVRSVCSTQRFVWGGREGGEGLEKKIMSGVDLKANQSGGKTSAECVDGERFFYRLGIVNRAKAI